MNHGPVWFDFDNTPHVLFLEPLLRGLMRSGVDCIVTSRRHAQTVELAAKRGIPAEAVGRGDFAGPLGKVFGVVGRAARLARWAGPRRPRMLVSSSRSGALAARFLGIPAVGLLDYEHAEQRILAFGCETIWLPDVLHQVDLPPATRRVAGFYPGLKENLYLDDWPLDRQASRRALGVGDQTYLVVARPPAETAHYASSRSIELWLKIVRALGARDSTSVLITARTSRQRQRLAGLLDEGSGIRFLTEVADGPDLVDAADLVVGGGGTMNREGAVLGVPVWSVFSGPAPVIDEVLAAEGRLRWIRSGAELAGALQDAPPERREGRGPVREGLQRILRDLHSRLEN